MDNSTALVIIVLLIVAVFVFSGCRLSCRDTFSKFQFDNSEYQYYPPALWREKWYHDCADHHNCQDHDACRRFCYMSAQRVDIGKRETAVDRVCDSYPQMNRKECIDTAYGLQ